MMTIQEAYAAGLVGGKKLGDGTAVHAGDAVISLYGDGSLALAGRIADVERADDGSPRYVVIGTFSVIDHNSRLQKAVYKGGLQDGIKLRAVLRTCNETNSVHVMDGEGGGQVVDRLMSMVPDGAGPGDSAEATLYAVFDDGDVEVCSCDGDSLPDVADRFATILDGVM